VFSNINVSHSSAATYARFSETPNNHFTANLLQNLTLEEFKRFHRIMAISLVCSIHWPTLYNTNKKSYVASQTQNRHAAAMTRVARNLLWHIQTSILDMAKRLLPVSCLLAGFDSGLKFR